MDKETQEHFEEHDKLFFENAFKISDLYNHVNQHATIINLNRDMTKKSIEEIELKLKAFQEDLDKVFDMLHDLKSLPNILEALKSVEKNKAD